MKDAAFRHAAEGTWTSPEPGVTRKVLVYRDEMMMVEVAFETGAVGALHSHPHVQSSYVAKGRLEVSIGDETQVLGPGGSFIVAPNVVHGVRALEESLLIDVFTPMRKEFV